VPNGASKVPAAAGLLERNGFTHGRKQHMAQFALRSFVGIDFNSLPVDEAGIV
jgi:hypothetical protein